MGLKNSTNKLEGKTCFISHYEELTQKYNIHCSEFDSSHNEMLNLYTHFHSLFPDDYMTKKQFVEENLKFVSKIELPEEKCENKSVLNTSPVVTVSPISPLTRDKRSSSYEVQFWENVFDFLDQDKNGKIDFKELLVLLLLSKSSSPKDNLEYVFDLLDVDKSGFLEECEIKIFLRVLFIKYKNILSSYFKFDNSNLSDDELVEMSCKKMFSMADYDNDNKISKFEFVKFCIKSPLIQDVSLHSFDSIAIIYNEENTLQLSNDEFNKLSKKGRKIYTKKIQSIVMESPKKEYMFKVFDEKESEFYDTFVMKKIKRPNEKNFFCQSFGKSFFKFKRKNVTKGIVKSLSGSMKNVNQNEMKIEYFLKLKNPIYDYKRPVMFLNYRMVNKKRGKLVKQNSIVKIWNNSRSRNKKNKKNKKKTVIEPLILKKLGTAEKKVGDGEDGKNNFCSYKSSKDNEMLFAKFFCIDGKWNIKIAKIVLEKLRKLKDFINLRNVKNTYNFDDATLLIIYDCPSSGKYYYKNKSKLARNESEGGGELWGHITNLLEKKKGKKKSKMKLLQIKKKVVVKLIDLGGVQVRRKVNEYKGKEFNKIILDKINSLLKLFRSYIIKYHKYV